MSHSFQDHTGEVLARVSAPSLQDLFVEAARALNQYLAEGVQMDTEGGFEEEIIVTAPDRETLLVPWLSEIWFRIDTKNTLYARFEILEFKERGLKARIFGDGKTRPVRDIKAVTHHGLQIRRVGDSFEADIIFDV